MPYTLVDGARLHVLDCGTDVPGATPLVMLHGLFTGSSASWLLTAAPTLSRRRRVRLVDWRGHGLSERPARGYGARRLAEDLAELTTDLPGFAVVGHSYGAIAAVHYALRHPGKVRALAIVDPPLSGDARDWWMSTECARVREIVLAPNRRSHQPGSPADLLATTSITDDLAREHPLSDRELRKLPTGVPVLAVLGSRSPFRAAAQRRIQRNVPHAELRLLTGGHDVHLAAPRELTALLDAFLSAPRPAPHTPGSPT